MKGVLILAWGSIVLAAVAIAAGVIGFILDGFTTLRISLILVDLLVIVLMSALIYSIKNDRS